MIEYKFVDNCNNTPVIPLYFRASHELCERNLNIDCVPYHHTQKAFVAFDEDVAVGFILIDDSEWRKTLTIILGYVIPQYRRKGIYTELFKQTVAKAKELGRVKIEGATRFENIPMQCVMDSLGRRAVSINYEYEVL